jgi:hypothetical protein
MKSIPFSEEALKEFYKAIEPALIRIAKEDRLKRKIDVNKQKSPSE